MNRNACVHPWDNVSEVIKITVSGGEIANGFDNWMRSENMRTLSSSCWHLLEAVVSARLWWPKGASGMNQAVRTTLSKTSHNHSFLQNLWWFPIYQELANYAPWTISILILVFSFFNWRIIALQYCVVFCHTTMWVDTWMNKKVVVQIYDGILLNPQKKQIWVSWTEVAEPRACYTEWSKSEREQQISYISTIYEI